MPTILTVGSLNVDLSSGIPRCPLRGETLTSTTFTTAGGGKGLNQCIATQRLSRASATSPSPTDITIRMVGRVGSDTFAPLLLSALSSNGISTDEITAVPDTPSGVAIIIVESETGDNRILIHPGANAALTPKEIRDDFFAYEGCGLVVLQLETPAATACRVIELAEKDFVPVLFNPAPAPVTPLPEDIWAKVRYLVVNESEAAVVAGVEASVLDTEEGVVETANTLKEMGAHNVIVTLGGRGCYYVGKKEGERGFVEAQNRGPVVDTTGAGDTFVGALAVAIVEGKELAEAVKWAGGAAGVSVTRHGAAGGVPWRGEVDVEEKSTE